MSALDPLAAARFEQGEELAVAGRLEEAMDSFKQAKAAFPDASLPERRICETMTALGKGPEGVGHCYSAVQASRTNVNLLATVRALVGGPAPPTLPNLAMALALVNGQRTRAPNHWEMSAALCDIADRIGDGDMLQVCSGELSRLAPKAPETLRALARIERRNPPLRFYFGWFAMAGLLLGTGAHAFGRRGRGRAGPAPAAVASGVGVVLAALVSFSGPAMAQPTEVPKGLLSKWQISDTDPESGMPGDADRNKDPLNFGYWLQDLIAKGQSASKRGDHEAAIRYYRAMIKAVPDKPVAYLKVCSEYEAIGDPDKAIAACGGALLLPGVKVNDYAHYVRLVLAQARPFTDKQIETLRDVLDNLKADPNAHPIADELDCELAARIGDRRLLEECVPAVVAAEPNSGKTIYYQWALALARNDFSEAGRLLERAKEAGVPPEGVSSMQAGLAKARRNRVWFRLLGALCFAFLGSAVFLFARRFVRRPPTQQPA